MTTTCGPPGYVSVLFLAVHHALSFVVFKGKLHKLCTNGAYPRLLAFCPFIVDFVHLFLCLSFFCDIVFLQIKLTLNRSWIFSGCLSDGSRCYSKACNIVLCTVVGTFEARL